MNFLGHLALSGIDEDVIFGNFVGDEIKGKQYLDWPESVATGMLLHRFIDSYTDTHALTLEMKKLVRPVMRKYSGVYMDIIWDHCLAMDWENYHSTSLEDFSQKMYQLLTEKQSEMPLPVGRMFGYMKRDDWLLNYASTYGINRALNGLSQRIPHVNHLGEGEQILNEHLGVFREKFKSFYSDIQDACAEWLEVRNARS